jgi:kynurenine formamidase
MYITLTHKSKKFRADLANGRSISTPLIPGATGPNCFYAPLFEASPVRMGNFVGSTAEGGLVNFFNVRINPHGNGTHTECIGHIAKEKFTVRQCLQSYHFAAHLTSVWPEKSDNGDRIIFASSLESLKKYAPVEAAIIRTMPNHTDKLTRMYSGTNPPYFDVSAVHLLNDCGIKHLITDLPSVDREEDGGKLTAHKTFWHYPENPQTEKTITELAYIPDEIPDGLYLLNMQIAAFELDASPSNLVLFELEEWD